MNKRLSYRTSIVLVLAVLAALAATWRPALASHLKLYALDPGDTIAVGKQGLSITNLPIGVTYALAGVVSEPLPARFDHQGKITFRPPALEVRFLNDNGGTVEDIQALVYVFFNIGKAERMLWYQSGGRGISIWYASELNGSWQKCPTYFVNENRDNGMFDRLACLAPGSGYYVLGDAEFDVEIFNDYTFDNQKVVAWRLKFGPQ